jgi:twitching motility protein PilT
LKYATIENISDVHIITNDKVKIRDKNWEITNLDSIKINDNSFDIPKLNKEVIIEIIKVIIWELWYKNFVNDLEFDSSYKVEWWDRYRVNCYVDTNWYSIALRRIPNHIPTLKELWFWEQMEELCRKWKWLILVTWPTGTWKSTNLAAMINYINSNYKKHIITIEDPVEFAFNSDKSLINQREVWNNTNWFNVAIRAVLREDPDVIMIWEMRDPETIKAAITLAETWHLVLSTLHTNDSAQTIDRIVDVFPWNQQKQIRMQLAMNLIWIISQKLLPRADKNWKIAAREVLINNDAVRNLIIEAKTHQLYSVLEIWKKHWMILMDRYIQILYDKWLLNKETVISNVRNKEVLEMMFN